METGASRFPMGFCLSAVHASCRNFLKLGKTHSGPIAQLVRAHA